MRILSDAEMQRIFGGDGVVAPLGTVVVDAGFGNGGAWFRACATFGWDEAHGGGGAVGCGTLSARPAMRPLLPPCGCAPASAPETATTCVDPPSGAPAR